MHWSQFVNTEPCIGHSLSLICQPDIRGHEAPQHHRWDDVNRTEFPSGCTATLWCTVHPVVLQRCGVQSTRLYCNVVVYSPPGCTATLWCTLHPFVLQRCGVQSTRLYCNVSVYSPPGCTATLWTVHHVGLWSVLLL